ncbi:MAG: hypothetical protein ACRCYU_24100 [Nocardioides sp.]
MPKNRKKYQNQKGIGRPRLRGRDRRISIRSELRAVPDVQKIARAVVALAMAQAEMEAQAAREAADADEVGHEQRDETTLPEASS